MKKSIPFETFGPNQFIYFDIKRLMRLEQLLGKSISNILATHDITISVLVNALMVGLSHHSKDNAAQWTEKVEEFFDAGGSIDDIGVPVIQAIVASGIFGKIEADEEKKAGEEKNVPETAKESTV